MLGPVDWTSTAALTEIAVREEPARGEVLALFGRLFELPLSPIRFMCLVEPLCDLAPRFPGLPATLREGIRRVRMRTE